jgi:tetratricopeptide (TPR) repeat protein
MKVEKFCKASLCIKRATIIFMLFEILYVKVGFASIIPANVRAVPQNEEIINYGRMLEKNPYDYYTLYLRGREYAKNNFLDDAINDFLVALKYMDQGKAAPSWINYDLDKLRGLTLLGIGEAYAEKENYSISNMYLYKLKNDAKIFSKCVVDIQMYVRVKIANNHLMLIEFEDALIQCQDNMQEESLLNNPSADMIEYYKTSISGAQYIMFYLDKPIIDAYLLNYADLEALGGIIESGSFQPLFHPVNIEEKYLHAALFLSTGLFEQALNDFSDILANGVEDIPIEDRNIMIAACLSGAGKASYMLNKSSLDEIMEYFEKEWPLIPDKRCDMLVDNLYWRSNLMLKMDDMTGYYNCLASIVNNSGIALLKDEISMTYFSRAQEIMQSQSAGTP